MTGNPSTRRKMEPPHASLKTTHMFARKTSNHEKGGAVIAS